MRKRTKIKRKSGALFTIATILAVSSVIRVGIGAGSALAKEPGMEKPAMETAMSDTAMTTPNGGEDPATLLGQLLERERILKEKEAALAMREVTLNRVEQEARRNLAEIEAAELRLKETLALSGTAAEADLERLTKVYETMKPKDAAALFEQMAPSFSAGFLGRMKPDAAAAILAGLPPELAYTVSLSLSGRNLRAPTD